MENVILVIHLILALGIIGLVLIQRSEGGGLGIGGGGGMGGLATPKGTASILTKMTAFFAACFFLTSLTLAILAGTHSSKDGILATYANEATITDDAPSSDDGTLQSAVPTETATDVVEGNEVEVEGDEAISSEPEAPNAETQTPVEKPSVPIGNE